MLKVLSIGNSFAVDSHTYLRDFARAGGVEMTLGNLYIGGCSLERHANNLKSGEAAYTYYKTDCEPRPMSLTEALSEEKWDVVTMHQASAFSGMWETYVPYMYRLQGAVQALAGGARLAVHQTWAYEIDSTHPGFANYNRDQAEMHARLKRCYARAYKLLGADLFIPSGEAMRAARAKAEFDYSRGAPSLCRDGYHASLLKGRYLLAATWFAALTGLDPTNVDFAPECAEETAAPRELALLREVARDAVKGR